MTVSNFGIQSVKFNGSFYSGNQGQAADYGRTIRTRGSDGIVQPTFRSISRLSPRAQWSSLAAKTWLAALNDSLDAPMKALDTTAGVVLYGAKAADSNAGYASGTVHEALTATHGLVYLNQLSWGGPDSDLIASLAALFISPGSDAAALVPSAVALPTQPIPTEAFDLTALTIAASPVDGVTGLSVDIDPKPRVFHNQGLVYPSKIFCAGVNDPVSVGLRFGLSDLALARTIGALGTTGQVQATFTSFTQNAAARSGSTIVLTFNNCLIHHPQAHDGRQGSEVKYQIEVLPRQDASNRQFAWSVT